MKKYVAPTPIRASVETESVTVNESPPSTVDKATFSLLKRVKL